MTPENPPEIPPEVKANHPGHTIESGCPQTRHCDRAFAELHRKLDKLDQAIRGNGTPGINVRLDRLEQDGRRQGKLLWMIVGALLSAAATFGAAWIGGAVL